MSMKEIKLTKGFVTQVDDEDYEYLNQLKWHVYKRHNTFYAQHTVTLINGNRTNIQMHRLIMNPPNNMQIDHINHNGLDNQKNNLRICTQSQNSMNQNSHKNSSSKYKGISWHKLRSKWESQIKYKGKHIHIGLYKTEVEAAKAYDEKAKELFGEFAHINFK